MGELSDWAENDALLGASRELGIRCRGTRRHAKTGRVSLRTDDRDLMSLLRFVHAFCLAS